MKRSVGWILVLLVAVALGYWASAQKTEKTTPETPRKILYYRNPMGLPDTSLVPKKDAMDMDYIPVYEGEENAMGNQIQISVEKIQKLGVKTEVAALRKLTQTVRAVGRIEPNERRVYSIAPKFEGWVEKLHVNAVGDVVKLGQPLFEIYSPELVSAQREYLIAANGVTAMQTAASEAQNGMQTLADSSLTRLQSWDINDSELQQLRKTGEVKRTLVYRSPVLGVVLEKPAVQGMRFMPGEMMYKIADLSTVWIMADVFEQDIGLIKVGQAAQVWLDAFPGREFKTRVAYIYPTLNEQTRTIPVRLEMANGEALLRPGMYAQVELLAASDKAATVTVPDSAVIHSGQRTLVLVELGAGRYEAREVKLGRHADDYIEVTEGISQDEKVVVSANFLIDAESNLKAVIGGLGSAHTGH
ncbi:MAG: efflux RND transporter periplasmic adaptor subunit [Gallionellaceae bacterium]|nr:efflux RND transporter periplasmic adaptor subunit [Gallionellaceae bacterium]